MILVNRAFCYDYTCARYVYMSLISSSAAYISDVSDRTFRTANGDGHCSKVSAGEKIKVSVLVIV